MFLERFTIIIEVVNLSSCICKGFVLHRGRICNLFLLLHNLECSRVPLYTYILKICSLLQEEELKSFKEDEQIYQLFSEAPAFIV